MNVHLLINEDPEGYRWRLVINTPTGADVVARSACEYPDERACHQAVAALAEARGEAMLVWQQPDGHWSWRVAGPDGQTLAESPAVFRDAASCGHALEEVREQLGYALVG